MEKIQGTRYVEIVMEKRGLAFWGGLWDRLEKILPGSVSKALDAHPPNLKPTFSPFPWSPCFQAQQSQRQGCGQINQWEKRGGKEG